jgi:hypothetical protein
MLLTVLLHVPSAAQQAVARLTAVLTAAEARADEDYSEATDNAAAALGTVLDLHADALGASGPQVCLPS